MTRSDARKRLTAARPADEDTLREVKRQRGELLNQLDAAKREVYRLRAEDDAHEFADEDGLRTAIEALADEWGISLRGDNRGLIDAAEDFAEAISDSGAWRFVRDLRAVLAAHPAKDPN